MVVSFGTSSKVPEKYLKIFYDKVLLGVTFSPLSIVIRVFDCIWYEFLTPPFCEITIKYEIMCRLIFENSVYWPGNAVIVKIMDRDLYNNIEKL